MKPKVDSLRETDCSPLDQTTESVDETRLVTVLQILVASGLINEDDVFNAWKLACR